MADGNGHRTDGFHHVAMRVRDFDHSVSFYGKGLGFSIVREWKTRDSRAVMLDMGGGAYLEIFERKNDLAATQVSPEGALLHFAVRTRNCDAALELARRAGAEVTVDPKNIDFPCDPVYKARIAFFKGPDGETVELFEER